MIKADEALGIILDETHSLGKEKVRLPESSGRTLATDVIAQENIPLFDNSAMDGFAVRSDDLSAATGEKPVTCEVIGESSAGNVFHEALGRYQAVQIMTGGKVPPGADSVVPIEQAKMLSKDRVAFYQAVHAGQCIRKAGEDIAKGSVALTSGTVITPPAAAILASLGLWKIRVTQRPHVNLLATGDEVVDVRSHVADGQIRNSNSYSLAGFVSASGAVPHILGIVGDKKKKLRKALLKCLACDVLLVTGGVSVGKYDLVKDILADIGVQIRFWKVNIKPGKPLAFGRFGKTLVFALPGNPASASVTFLQFVRPALHKMLGRRALVPVRLAAVLEEDFSKQDGKRHFPRGVARSVDGTLHVRLAGHQSSGVMSSFVAANCLMIVPEGVTRLTRGAKVEVELLDTHL